MNFLTSAFVNNNDVYKCIIEMLQCSVPLKNINFEESKIYDIKHKENIIDISHRSSKVHKIYYNQSQGIFKSIEKLIDMINEKKQTLFTLIPNDIDIVKYETGDFFNRHSDFVPIKTKYLSYYTMLFCIDANCIGGETSLFLDGENRIDFSETVTPNEWLLFRNEIEHCGNQVISGHKIILKANIVHTDLSNCLFNPQFDKLISAKNEVITDFMSKSGNILPIHSLTDYIFYRNCFKDCENVVPFQFLKCNDLSDSFKIHFAVTKSKGKNGKESDNFGDDLDNSDGPDPNSYSINTKDNIKWFNIGNLFPIIYLTYETDNNDEDKGEDDEKDLSNKIIEIKRKIKEIEDEINESTSLKNGFFDYDDDDDDDSDDDDDDSDDDDDDSDDSCDDNGVPKNKKNGVTVKEKKIQINLLKKRADALIEKMDDLNKKRTEDDIINNIDNKIKDLIHNNNDINEIARAISIMIYFFWINAIKCKDDNDDKIIDFYGKKEELQVNNLIAKKVEENLRKIHEKELEAFGLEKLPDHKIGNAKKMFTNDFIDKIIKKFDDGIINYHQGGAHFCNECVYDEIKAEINFGFVRI
jgi:hypothetical protein